MLQRNADKMTPGLETRKNGTPPNENRDALLEAKDKTIAELEKQVALLRSELKRKDAILSRVAGGNGELMPARASKAADGSQTVTPGGVQDGNQAKDAQKEQKKSGRPTLPDGYRVVAVASDTWVLVAPRGLRVAGYRGGLDLWKVALDAREHHQRK